MRVWLSMLSLASVLPQTKVHALDLGFNALGASAGAALVSVLPRTKLRHLNLKFNKLPDSARWQLQEEAAGKMEIVV